MKNDKKAPRKDVQAGEEKKLIRMGMEEVVSAEHKAEGRTPNVKPPRK